MKFALAHLALFSFTLLAKQPNVVFILVDDLGARDLTNEGSTFYETPNIDRIAYEGMKFTRGYASCQVCSPSRASILTGKYPTNHGITQYIGGPSGEAHRSKGRHDSHLPPEYERNLRASEITLAEAMRDAGYKTFFAGKWHLGSKGSWPTDHGFDINKGGFDAGGPRGGFFAPYQNPNLKSGPKGESLTIRLGQETADFIESQKDSKQPFLAYLSFYTVHAPIQTTEALYKKYRAKAKKMGLDKAEERYLFDRRLNVRQVQDNPIYAGMMEQLDQSIGLVLAKLDELGIADNTIVCFTSDNGGVSSGDAYATSNLPLRGGKGRQWEGGIREPYYIKAPGVAKAGSTTDVLASGIDWYPTLLDLCGIADSQEAKSRWYKLGIHTPSKNLTSTPPILALPTLWKPRRRALLHNHGRRLETYSLPRDGPRRALQFGQGYRGAKRPAHQAPQKIKRNACPARPMAQANQCQVPGS